MADLTDSLVERLSGENLDASIGYTILLIACGDDGWPRVASLSVGEVLAVSRGQVFLTLYSRSRTTAALAATGRGMLFLVDDGAIHRIQIEVEPVDAPTGEGRSTFRGNVVAVERDEVPYARVLNGVEFELVDQGGVVERWRRQLEELRQASKR